MEYVIGNFKIIVENDVNAQAVKCSEILAEQINKNKSSVMGFATGSSPIKTYERLVQMYKDGKVDFSGITSFNLDEYYYIEKSNSQSYDYFMGQNLFNHVNINKSNINVPNGETDNVEKECVEYEEKIKAAGGIDMQLLGIGLNGHIGFNEPADVFSGYTQRVDLAPSTIEANSRFFESAADVPKQAISMGIRSIMAAEKIVLIASGTAKAEIIRDMIYSDITPKIPATALQLHRNVTVVLDKEAAALLS